MRGDRFDVRLRLANAAIKVDEAPCRPAIPNTASRHAVCLFSPAACLFMPIHVAPRLRTCQCVLSRTVNESGHLFFHQIFPMYIVAIAWLYVVLMMSITERSIVAGVATFLLYGVAPLALFLWLVGTPARRRRREKEQQEVQQRERQHQQPQETHPASQPQDTPSVGQPDQ